MEGILPLFKEKGMTSHDCIYRLRKILNTKKIGHAGTLDPMAEGVLPIAIGPATKVLQYLLESKKAYRGQITLGYSTTTEDASGEIVNQKTVNRNLSTHQIDETMKDFQGYIQQVPPMYSAIKVGGKKLYEYARNNEPVDRPVREVWVGSFKRTNPPTFNADKGTLTFDFEVLCGKGTYIRTLAVDLGKKLNYPSHMSKLVRTLSGGFCEDQALTLQQVQELVNQGRLDTELKSIDSVLKNNFNTFEVNQEWCKKIKNGLVFSKEVFPNLTYPILFSYQGKAIAIYDLHPRKEDQIKPVKVFNRLSSD